MTGGQVLDMLKSRGVVLEPHGDRLHYRAPQGALTQELREAIAEHKAEILDLLSEPQKRNDGQAPPLDRPRGARQTLWWPIKDLADSRQFAAWLEKLMRQVDVAEES